MPQDRIESRRAFMKKLGKLAGAVAYVAPFIATIAKDAVAASETEKPRKDGCEGCGYSCKGTCTDICTGTCGFDCYGTCTGMCAVGCGGSCALISK